MENGGVYNETTEPRAKLPLRRRCGCTLRHLRGWRLAHKVLQPVLSFLAVIFEEIVKDCINCHGLYFFEFVSCSAFLLSLLILSVYCTIAYETFGKDKVNKMVRNFIPVLDKPFNVSPLKLLWNRKTVQSESSYFSPFKKQSKGGYTTLSQLCLLNIESFSELSYMQDITLLKCATHHLNSIYCLVSINIHQAPMTVNGCHFFSTWRNSVPLLCFILTSTSDTILSGCPSAAICHTATTCNGIVVGRFSLCWHQSTSASDLVGHHNKLGGITFRAAFICIKYKCIELKWFSTSMVLEICLPVLLSVFLLSVAYLLFDNNCTGYYSCFYVSEGAQSIAL
uniref:Uncharacterized protein n=1 Tax=Coturnix japonica TaxID=93934 RepID=A0A8C2TLL4_COTJA